MYRCKECDKGFSTKSNLNRHVNTQHDDVNQSGSEGIEDEEDTKYNDNEDNTINVWFVMTSEAETRNITISQVYKEKILFYNALKFDASHKAIMKTSKGAREMFDMDFLESVEYAIDKRKFLLKRMFDNQFEDI